MARSKYSIDMKEKRVLFLHQLRPPADYTLSFALACTYSLDATTLIGSCLALADFDYDTDNAIETIGALKALRTIAENERLAVFYDQNRIRFPEGRGALAKELAPLIETMVFPCASAKGALHAKVWLVDYVSEKADGDQDQQHILRLCTTSRNISEGNLDSDLWLTIEAESFSHTAGNNVGLAHLVSYLAQDPHLSANQKTKLTELEDLVTHAEFAPTEPYTEFEFYTFIDGEQFPKCPLFGTEEYDAVTVVSPFLKVRTRNSPLAKLSNRGAYDKVLMSTDYGFKQAIGNKDVPTILESWDCYKPRELTTEDLEQGWGDTDDVNTQGAVTQETSLDQEAPSEDDSGSIFSHHAKAYAVKHKDTQYSDLYIGSLNATVSALNSNIEVLARLRSQLHLPDLLFRGLRGGGEKSENYRYVEFKPTVTSLVSDDDKKANDVLHAFLNTLDLYAHVEQDDKRFHIVLECIDFSAKAGRTYEIQPLLWRGPSVELQKGETIEFSNMNMADISCFFLISDSTAKTTPLVFKADLDCGAIPDLSYDVRWDAVEAKGALKNTASLLRFLYAFFPDPDTYSLANSLQGQGLQESAGGSWASSRAWYEWLLGQSTNRDGFDAAVSEARAWLQRMRQVQTQHNKHALSHEEKDALVEAEKMDQLLQLFEGLPRVHT